MKSDFRGVFLTATDPSATAKFYQEIAGLPLEKPAAKNSYVYWKFDVNGLQFAIHEAQAFAKYAHPPLAGSNLTHL